MLNSASLVSVSHCQTRTSPSTKEEPCAIGRATVPHTVLPCSALGNAALGTAMPSAPSGMPLKIFAFGEPLTQVVPTEKPAAQHTVSSQLTMLSCNYTQPLPELCGKSVYPSPSNWRREDLPFLIEVTLLDVPIHTTGCRTKFLIRQLGMLVFCFSDIPLLI